MEENRILTILQENYDDKIINIEFLRDSGGTAYIVNNSREKFLLKIAGRAFQDTIWQSVEVVRYLFENRFPVPAVIETKSGKLILEILEKGQEYLFILYEYIEGKEPELCVCGEKAGELIGQLHKQLLSYEGKLAERDFEFFVGRYIEILRKKNYPQIDRYINIGKNLWDCVKDCPIGICHGDLHRGNLLEAADGKIYLFDFDTICIAPRMFDIAVMCDMTDYFNLQPDDIKTTTEVYKNFLAGYIRENDLTEAEQDSFHCWVAIRHFQLQATIVHIYGMDCIDNAFIDRQLKWLEDWCGQGMQ